MSRFLLAAFSMIAIALLMACCPESSKGVPNKGDYDIIKVCSIGDTDGTTCVQYAAKRRSTWGNGSFLEIKTPDGNTYDFNTAGWSILIVEK